jgi:phosphatidate cytidylyltransferase
MAPVSRTPSGRERPGRGERPVRPAPAATDGTSARPRSRRPSGRGQAADAGSRRGSELLARVLIAIPAAILAIAFVNLGGTAWAVLMIVFGCLCLSELYRVIARWRPAPIVGFLTLAAMVLVGRFGTQRDVLEVAVIALPVTFLAVMARGGGGIATVSIAGTLLGIYWIGFGFAHAELLRQEPHGAGVLIDVMVGTFLGDTGAYLGGRVFGRRPLALTISPHKTVEGLVCGMLIAILAVFIAGLEQPWLTQTDALLLGLAVAVLGPLGDLFESMIKRDANTKDAGHVFGAHGGALDRLDAIIFTVVAGYYVWTAVLH